MQIPNLMSIIHFENIGVILQCPVFNNDLGIRPKPYSRQVYPRKVVRKFKGIEDNFM